MQEYRLYFLDREDRHVTRSFDFEAKDDEAAIRVAESWREGRAMELWNGTRKVRGW